MIDIRKAAEMREATRLTRAGRLHEATAIIQQTLKGEMGPKSATYPHRTGSKTTIEGRSHLRADERGTHGQQPALPGAVETSTGPAALRKERTTNGFMAGLRESWRRLRGPKPISEPSPYQTPDIVPDGGHFITGSYANRSGMRTYKLYVPSGYRGQPLPLVVMLHGCTQNSDDFAAGTRMNALGEEHQFFVAYPEQSPTANGSKCWNWFEAGHQQRDRGEPSIIAGLARQIVDRYGIDGDRVYVAGLSAGGAMALTLAITHPDLFAAVGIHSGLPHAVAKDLPSAFAAMNCGQVALAGRHAAGGPGTRRRPAPVPAIVFHGDRDTTVHPCNGDKVIAQCVPAHTRRGAQQEGGPTRRVSVERGEVQHGHSYKRTTYHNASGQSVGEHWLVHGAGHAWSGGSVSGSYTDPKGPDASKEMFRFFCNHPQRLATT